MMNNFKYFGILSVAVVALTGLETGAFAADSTSGFGQINMTKGIVQAVKAGDTKQLKGAVGSIAKPIVTSNVAKNLNGLVGPVMKSNGTLDAKGLSAAVTGSSVVQNIGSSLGLSSQMTGTVANLGLGLALNGGNVGGIVKQSMPAIKTAAKAAVVTAGAKAINDMLGASAIGPGGKISMSGVKDALGNSGTVADLKTNASGMLTSAKDTVSGWFSGGASGDAGGAGNFKGALTSGDGLAGMLGGGSSSVPGDVGGSTGFLTSEKGVAGMLGGGSLSGSNDVSGFMTGPMIDLSGSGTDTESLAGLEGDTSDIVDGGDTLAGDPDIMDMSGDGGDTLAGDPDVMDMSGDGAGGSPIANISPDMGEFSSALGGLGSSAASALGSGGGLGGLLGGGGSGGSVGKWVMG